MMKRQRLGFPTKIIGTNLQSNNMDMSYGEECILDTCVLSRAIKAS